MMPGSLIAAARRLADVLDLENNALRAMDLRAAAALLPEKGAAIASMTEAGESSTWQTSSDLVSTVRRLDVLAKDNRRLLERAIDAQQRVIGIVLAAAASTSAIEPSYGARGHYALPIGPMALSTRA